MNSTFSNRLLKNTPLHAKADSTRREAVPILLRQSSYVNLPTSGTLLEAASDFSIRRLECIHEFDPVLLSFRPVSDRCVELRLGVEEHVFVIVLDGRPDGDALPFVSVDRVAVLVVVGDLLVDEAVDAEIPVAHVLPDQIVDDEFIARSILGVRILEVDQVLDLCRDLESAVADIGGRQDGRHGPVVPADAGGILLVIGADGRPDIDGADQVHVFTEMPPQDQRREFNIPNTR
ncbi:hypothetical protein DESC_390059 [Desulfosarcina cetonica]|nr:hypothetical protein DESC_390059 [Desulfosarcina cetonica]